MKTRSGNSTGISKVGWSLLNVNGGKRDCHRDVLVHWT